MEVITEILRETATPETITPATTTNWRSRWTKKFRNAG